MSEDVKKITVIVREGTSVEDVASRLRQLGMQAVSELTHIGCVTGEWNGALDEVESVDGVENVEEQKSRYYPT